MTTDYEQVKTVLKQIVPMGLTADIGEAKPGKMCIEAAICFAMGEPHGDEPSCVATQDRLYSITINACQRYSGEWSTDLARAEALLPLAIAQLGTSGTDRREWIAKLALGTVRRVLPIALDAAGMPSHAQACRNAENLVDAYKAASSARIAAYAAKSENKTIQYAGNAAEHAARAAICAERINTADVAASNACSAAADTAIAAAESYSATMGDSCVARDAVLRESVAVALEAYALTKTH